MVDADAARRRLMQKQPGVPSGSSMPGTNSHNSDRRRRDILLAAAIPEELVDTLRDTATQSGPRARECMPRDGRSNVNPETLDERSEAVPGGFAAGEGTSYPSSFLVAW